METWVFRGGRWKVISERWIITSVLFTSTLAGMAGFAAGLLLMESRYERRIDTIQSTYKGRVEAAEQEISASNSTLKYNAKLRISANSSPSSRITARL
jgi:hypothetical protein